MARIAMLAFLVPLGCHQYVRDSRPRVIECKATLEMPTVAPGQPVKVRVALTNRGPARTWIGRTIERVNSTWIIDGTDLATRSNDAVHAALSVGAPAEVSFAGASGEGTYGAEHHRELAPNQVWTATLEVAQSVGGSVMKAGDLDISDDAIVGRILSAPGKHELQLIVKSYPHGAYWSDEGIDYTFPGWEAPCNPVSVEVRP